MLYFKAVLKDNRKPSFRKGYINKKNNNKYLVFYLGSEIKITLSKIS